MEALELYKEEIRKMEEHKYACERPGNEVNDSLSHCLREDLTSVKYVHIQ